MALVSIAKPRFMGTNDNRDRIAHLLSILVMKLFSFYNFTYFFRQGLIIRHADKSKLYFHSTVVFIIIPLFALMLFFGI